MEFYDFLEGGNVSEYQFQMPFKRQSTSGKSALENFFVCSTGSVEREQGKANIFVDFHYHQMQFDFILFIGIENLIYMFKFSFMLRLFYIVKNR